MFGKAETCPRMAFTPERKPGTDCSVFPLKSHPLLCRLNSSHMFEDDCHMLTLSFISLSVSSPRC